MSRHRLHQRRALTIGFNATPMFDMMFTLTIFFMLVCKLSSAELVRMELPNPDKSQAKAAKLTQQVVINCRPADAGASARSDGRDVLYSIGPNAPESLASISQRLSAMKAESERVEAVIRADRRLPYSEVRAVMRVLAENGIEVLNVVAHIGESG